MEKDFVDKIEAVKLLALLAKEKGKKWPNEWWMLWNIVNSLIDQLLEKLKSFTEIEIIAETIFSEMENCT